VDPDTASVQVHILDKDRFITNAYAVVDPEDKLGKYTSDKVPVFVLPGLEIDLKTVFPPAHRKF
jgi:hypothetical protein